MSEHILKAIVQLFALLARIDGVKKSERNKIESLLKRTIGESGVERLVQDFDLYSGYQPHSSQEYNFASTEDILKTIRQICIKIKNEAGLAQRVSLISQIIQLVIADDELTSLENEAIELIARELNIAEEILENIKQFLLAKTLEDFNNPNILIIQESQSLTPTECRYIKASKLSGFIAVLHIRNIKTLYARYMGSDFILHNTAAVETGRIEAFPPGSNFRGDKLEPIYYSDIISAFKAETIDHKITFVADEITYRFKKGNYGLRGITISETEAKLIGIMGASGSGKSTLINILNGNEKPTSGSVQINSLDLHQEPEKLEGAIGYVPQDDLLIEDLTVFQNLFYSAKLCFGDKSDEEITRLVDKTLYDLGLQETKNLKVGNVLNKTISGGQRKRVNIGLELLREPLIMFVDEPTSGLSSHDSENIMDLLKELSLSGKLIFVVIHQPSSEIFKMFDRLLILDVGGYPVYYGNPVEAIDYFRNAIRVIDKTNAVCLDCGNVNTEQIFNIIESKIVDEYGYPTKERRYSPQHWHRIYQENNAVNTDVRANGKSMAALHIPGKIRQAKIFIQRDFLSKISNRQYVLINLLEAPLLGFILSFFIRFYPRDGFVDSEYSFMDNVNLPVYMFMAVIVGLFIGLTVSAEEIIKDKKILKREAFLHLSRSSYLASKLVILFSLSAIQALAFVLIGNAVLEVKGMFFTYWAVFFSISCFANVLGLNISSAFNSVVTIYILIPLLLIPQLLLSGVMVKYDELNPQFTSRTRVPVIGELMAAKWGYEALVVSQFRDNEYEKQFYQHDKVIATSDFKTVYYLPKLMSKLDHLMVNYGSDDQDLISAMKSDVKVLRHEIAEELELVGADKFPEFEQLSYEAFDSAMYQHTKAFFDSLRKFYQLRHQNATKLKEALIKEITNSPAKRKDFERLRKQYTNEQVSSIALNNKVSHRIIEENDELIQKIYPVYMDPDPHHFFDFTSQMYQPQKYFAGFYINTLAFNLLAIWCMTLFLIVALYFEWLKKLVSKG